MKRKLSDYEVDNLRNDAKTLVDISRMMELDGRFKVLPSMLDGIARDIEEILPPHPALTRHLNASLGLRPPLEGKAFGDKGVGKEVVV